MSSKCDFEVEILKKLTLDEDHVVEKFCKIVLEGKVKLVLTVVGEIKNE